MAGAMHAKQNHRCHLLRMNLKCFGHQKGVSLEAHLRYVEQRSGKMTHKRAYKLHIQGDAEIVAFLKRRVPTDWDRLGPARERARAIELLFPNVKAQAISLQKQADVGVMKRL
jgi:hypothetical protein